jgi:hypothetical protein
VRARAVSITSLLNICAGAVVVQLGAVCIASAAVVISGGTTKNMTCSGGVCSPTAVNAVLNVAELESLLAAGDATVTTSGSQIEADDIRIKAALSWTSASTLSLHAAHAIEVDKHISVAGPAGLIITTDGVLGNFYFGAKGNVTFLSTSSQLAINGQSYTLVNDIASLASAIASNPAGNYALADNYDALGDGTYSASPIAATFTGRLEGLGNTISHVSIDHRGHNERVGFINSVLGGSIENFGLTHISFVLSHKGSHLGGLTADSFGQLSHDLVSGRIRVKTEDHVNVGGLVGSKVELSRIVPRACRSMVAV